MDFWIILNKIDDDDDYSPYTNAKKAVGTNKKQNQHPVQKDKYDKNSYAKRTDTLYISIK